MVYPAVFATQFRPCVLSFFILPLQFYQQPVHRQLIIRMLSQSSPDSPDGFYAFDDPAAPTVTGIIQYNIFFI
jgi:hypothetical protein